jgi:hypothetical protein
MADNVKVTTKGSIMTIEVDLSKSFGMSKSGKTTVIATTGGTMAIGDGVIVNLNVNKK